MDLNFWRQLWDNNEIGFHQSNVNGLLADYFHMLSLPQNSRIFVPLCGKTQDIAWLLSQGHRVVGVELSKLAVEQLFADLDVVPKISNRGNYYAIVRLILIFLWVIFLCCLVICLVVLTRPMIARLWWRCRPSCGGAMARMWRQSPSRCHNF